MQKNDPITECKHCGKSFNGDYILVGLSIACPHCKKLQESLVKVEVKSHDANKGITEKR